MTIFNREFNVIYVRVVQGCNLNCSHCFTLGNKDPIMITSLDVIDKFITPIATNVAPEKATIYIHGGETFLAPVPYLRDVNALIRKRFAHTKLDIIPQTNLTFKITDEFIAFLKEEYRGTVGVSWDANIRFDNDKQERLFFRNLRKLLDNDIDVHIAITTTKYLLDYDPLDLVKPFDGVKSIDFELLTVFDDKTLDLKPNNKLWAAWLDQLVEFYQQGTTTWCLPQVDMFVKQMLTGNIVDCKCNCCDRRTFTLNPNGTVGLCPDMTYIKPISNVGEINRDWSAFESAALNVIVDKIDKQQQHDLCYTCEHFELCGGNCELALFDDTDECPLSRKVVSRIRDNLNTFETLFRDKATHNLTELRDDYNEDT